MKMRIVVEKDDVGRDVFIPQIKKHFKYHSVHVINDEGKHLVRFDSVRKAECFLEHYTNEHHKERQVEIVSHYKFHKSKLIKL